MELFTEFLFLKNKMSGNLMILFGPLMDVIIMIRCFYTEVCAMER